MPQEPRRQWFFHKHRRLITLVGAFIVFLTFVVKEALREQVKDRVDSLRWAETTSDLTTDLQGNFMLSLELKRSVDSIRTRRVQQNDSDRPAKVVIRNELDDIELYLAEDWSAYHGVNELIDSFPDSEVEFRKTVKTLRAKRDSLDKMDSELTRTSDKMNSSLRFRDVDDSVVDEVSDLGEGSEQFLRDIGELNGKAIDRLNELKLVAEKRYECYSWLSYGLYAMGWSLALIGRLHGLESPTD